MLSAPEAHRIAGRRDGSRSNFLSKERHDALSVADALLIVVVAHDHPAVFVGDLADLVALVRVALPLDSAVPPEEIHAVAHAERRLPALDALEHDLVLQDVRAIEPGDLAAPPLRDLVQAPAVGGPALEPARLHHLGSELAEIE